MSYKHTFRNFGSLVWFLAALIIYPFSCVFAQGPPAISWAKGGAYSQTAPGLVLSSNGLWLASASRLNDRTYVKLWRVPDQMLLRTWQVTAEVAQLDFSPDNTLLVAACADATIRVWRVTDGGLLKILTGHQMGVYAVRFSRDGATLASGGYNEILLWNSTTLALERRITGSFEEVFALDFSPHNNTLASGNGDKSICVWTLADGTLIHKLVSHQDHVSSVAFSPSGALLASGSVDETIRVWKPSDDSLLYTVSVLGGASSITFSPVETELASWNSDRADIRRVSDGGSIRTLWQRNADAPLSVAFGRNWTSAAAATALLHGNYQIERKRIVDGSVLPLVTYYGSAINSVDILANQRRLAAGGGMVQGGGTGGVQTASQPSIFVQDFLNGTLVSNLVEEPYLYNLQSVALSPDGTKVASGGDWVRVWRLSDSRMLWKTNAEVAVFSPDSRFLAASTGNEVHLYLANSGTGIESYLGHTDAINAIAFSADETVLATGSRDRTLRLWRVMDGSWLRTIEHGDTVSAVALSSDGLYVALAGGGDASEPDFRVRVCRTETGELVTTLVGHTQKVTGVAFVPNTNVLASVSHDGTLRFWRIPDGALLRHYDQDIEQANCLVFSAEGRWLAYGRQDSAVVVARNPFSLADEATELRFLPDALAGPVDGWVTYALSGRSGANIEIESSKDFMNWTTVTRTTNETGIFFFPELVSGADRCFYRARYP